ncbi:MAG: LCP family protein [Lachnospiraceae bacterium]|nr:LCP family protein [Lachnospiraceae bacterium]
MAVKSVKERDKRHRIGLILALIQLVLTVVCLGFVLVLNLLSTTYVLIIGVVLLLIWLIVLLTQFTQKMHIGGKVVSLLMCVVLAMGSYFMLRANSLITNITSSDYKIDKIVVVVMANDAAESLNDAADYQFGIQASLDRDKTDQAISEIEDQLGSSLNTKEYSDMDSQVQALYDGEVQAIIMNEGMRTTIEEDFDTFTDDTKTLENIEIKTAVKAAKDIDVTKDCFTIYISGIDVFGDISTNSRSDVNIIATINPTTRQILLTTTPRDYYVEFPNVTNGEKDKLTHAGIYGVDCSMETLEELYGGIDIDYYVRVNFSGVEQIIDAMDGITVHSDYAFTTHLSPYYTYSKGDNEMNGAEALWFARDRKSVPGGERQRGKDQQYVIEGMIDKMCSPSVLTNYTDILSAVSGCVQTNLSDAQLKSLVKAQTEDSTAWNITSLSADGKNARDYCYSYQGKSLYVMVPDYDTVEYIEGVMQKVYDGEILTEEDEENMPETAED